MNDSAVGTLVLLRHGESIFNATSTFTGLLDVPLTDAGERQVGIAARLLREAGLAPGLLVTTPMRRALRTTELLLSGLGIDSVSTVSTWRLIERDYGCLTGVSKRDARERHGEEAFHIWRRTMHGSPPAASGSQRAAWLDPAPVTDHGPIQPGCGESLADVVARVTPVWSDVVRPALASGTTVFVVAHGNSLRALCAAMEHLTDAETEDLNIPAGHPLTYRYSDPGPHPDADHHPNSSGAVSPRGGRYLDDVAARTASELVAAEGGT